MGYSDDIVYAQLEHAMIWNNCSSSDFERVRQQKYTLGESDCERLQAFMGGTKIALSVGAGLAGYFLGNYVAQQFCDDNIVSGVIGGLAALTLAKLMGKPAARVGLDLGLRTRS